MEAGTLTAFKQHPQEHLNHQVLANGIIVDMCLIVNVHVVTKGAHFWFCVTPWNLKV